LGPQNTPTPPPPTLEKQQEEAPEEKRERKKRRKKKKREVKPSFKRKEAITISSTAKAKGKGGGKRGKKEFLAGKERDHLNTAGKMRMNESSTQKKKEENPVLKAKRTKKQQFPD